MARGKRETFILNPLNPKDNVILKFLEKQFNRSEAIRDILFQYASTNGNDITKVLSNYDNNIVNILSQNDNDIITLSANNTNNFKRDVGSIEELIKLNSKEENKNWR